MPTGYTNCILEGATFEQFVWRAARGMGAFIMQRDDSLNAPPQLEEKPSDYYVKALEDAKAKLAAIREWTDADWSTAFQKYVSETEARNAEYAAKHAADREKYMAMLQKVTDWQPPTADHQGLKKFMLEQIKDSIRFDCSGEPYRTPVRPFAEWRASELVEASADISRYENHLEEEIERAESRNQWKRQLAESVPLPA